MNVTDTLLAASGLLGGNSGGGGGGGEAVLINKSVTANGTYNASSDSADGYKKVTVNVPQPTLVSKTISANGTYDPADDNADGYSGVTVDVEGYTIEDMVDHAKPVGEVTVALAITANTGAYRHGLDYRTGITGLNLPNATAVPNYFCNYCTNLETVNAPEALFLGESAFSHTKIRYGVFPKLKALINYAMSDNAALEAVDFLGGAYPGDYSGLARTGVFNNCSSLATLVIRSTAVVNLYGTNVLTGTPFASGKSGGTVYVPAALVDSYKSATNWSTIFGYGNGEQNAILPIEGSVYETQYVDGTPIPAA